MNVFITKQKKVILDKKGLSEINGKLLMRDDNGVYKIGTNLQGT